MKNSIPDPVPGRDVIDWAKPVTDRLNSLDDKVGAPFRNERDRRGRGDLSCFRIAKLEHVRSESGEITQIDVSLANLYYRIAGKTYLLEPPEEEEEESGVSSQESEESTDPSALTPDPFYHVSSDMHRFIIALKVPIADEPDDGEEPAAEVRTYPSLEEMRTAENVRDTYIFPLYLFEDWAVKVDLRTAPGLIMTEFDADATGSEEEEEE